MSFPTDKCRSIVCVMDSPTRKGWKRRPVVHVCWRTRRCLHAVTVDWVNDDTIGNPIVKVDWLDHRQIDNNSWRVLVIETIRIECLDPILVGAFSIIVA